MVETHPFASFVPANAKHLLLGSFTGKTALNETGYDWYYGTKRNQFWQILEIVYNVKLSSKKEKQDLFAKLGMAVTDIIYQCERKESTNSDSNLTNIVYNYANIQKILRHNKIKTIYFTSRFVEKMFKKNFARIMQDHPLIKLVTLPSPSSRYAKMTMQEKAGRYKKVLPPMTRENTKK